MQFLSPAAGLNFLNCYSFFFLSIFLTIFVQFSNSFFFFSYFFFYFKKRCWRHSHKSPSNVCLMLAGKKIGTIWHDDRITQSSVYLNTTLIIFFLFWWGGRYSFPFITQEFSQIAPCLFISLTHVVNLHMQTTLCPC